MSTALAKRTATALQPVSLDEAVRAIHLKFDEAIKADIKAHKARIATGQLLLDLRRRIESGEAGADVEWWPWYESKFVRSRKDAERLMRIASAEDPEAALIGEREKTRIAVAKHREKKAVELTVSSKLEATVSVVADAEKHGISTTAIVAGPRLKTTLKKRVEGLRHAASMVFHTCLAAASMEIPYIDREEADDIAEQLAEAAANISTIIKRLQGVHQLETRVGIDAARRYYLDRCAEPDIDLDAEQEIIIDALREIAGKRAISAQATRDDLDIPPFLDRRRP
jgi:hypothetical protein